MAYQYGELQFDYGDKLILDDGEEGVVTGFMGRGRNRVMFKLKPTENGNGLMRIVDATKVFMIEKRGRVTPID